MNNDKKQLWVDRIQDYKSSGLTATKWCEDNNTSVHKLRYQINKINNEDKQNSKQTVWASIIPAIPIAEKELEKPLKVTIGQSTIEVAPGFDPETFESVVRILASQC